MNNGENSPSLAFSIPLTMPSSLGSVQDLPETLHCGVLASGPPPSWVGLNDLARRVFGFIAIPFMIGLGGMATPHPGFESPSQLPLALEKAATGHRSRELRFHARHPEVLRALSGQWVVLEGETIIAHGQNPISVVQQARARGVLVPLVLKVEEVDNSVWMGL